MVSRDHISRGLTTSALSEAIAIKLRSADVETVAVRSRSKRRPRAMRGGHLNGRSRYLRGGRARLMASNATAAENNSNKSTAAANPSAPPTMRWVVNELPRDAGAQR